MRNANEESYETMEMLGQTVLFTNARIDRNTVPQSIYVYDLRDACDGNIYSVEKKVVVNHFGTILCQKEIYLTDDKYRAVSEEDYSFLGENMKLDAYMEQDFDEEQEGAICQTM